MGAYLNTPMTDKESHDETNDRLVCGASCMQGWRVSQEDAHNVLLDFDANTSLFAVYDGHGGHEVAQYCAKELPRFLKESESYGRGGDMTEALEQAFLGFDASIITPDVLSILKDLAGDRDAAEEEDDPEEDDMDGLYEEANMPIEKVIEKYTNNSPNPVIGALKDEKFPKSPCLKAKKESDATVGTSGGCSRASTSDATSASDGAEDGVSSSSEAKENSPKKSESNGAESSSASSSASTSAASGSAISEPQAVASSKVSVPDSSDMTVDAAPSESAASGAVGAATSSSSSSVSQNGNSAEGGNDVSSSFSMPAENGDVKGKGKGKAKAKPKPKPAQRPKRNAAQLYRSWLEASEKCPAPDTSEDESEEEDKTFEGPVEKSSDEEEEESINTTVEAEASDVSGSTSGEEEEEEEEEEDCDEEYDEDDEGLAFGKNINDPGFDSGCTAVVALLKGNDLYVANAGDSRCIVSRQGKAEEMSIDHKPEDELEERRIVKAGGEVTFDGRVNGGLNLSRAIGDHACKQNKELSDREQMITALPDVKHLTIDPASDEFMVLACDGIWNCMSSQEVVDFVKARLSRHEKMSAICEELFDHCLASNTLGDGTGCDNMTAIIVKFKTTMKRPHSPNKQSGEEVHKRAKTETMSDAGSSSVSESTQKDTTV